MRRAVIDERLAVRIVSERPLRYTRSAHPGDDRPDHVRAASGLAVLGDRLIIIQDDAAFLAIVDGEQVDAVALPAGAGGRRRFEVALGNKLDKPDLEACLVDDGELLAFGSGSLAVRERLARWSPASGATFVELSALYGRVRDAVGGVLNIEGAARVGDELWLFHRGNTGPGDPGPSVVRLAFAGFRAHLAGAAVPDVRAVDRYDLGHIAGVALGFTDATSDGEHVLFVAAAEASADAIADGAVLGSLLGVIDRDGVRCAPLVGLDGLPLKVEGLALVPGRRDRAWVTVDPDDTARPAPLIEVELRGPWW
jgi:hypothetical protein